jgi:hypothetical protein
MMMDAITKTRRDGSRRDPVSVTAAKLVLSQGI